MSAPLRFDFALDGDAAASAAARMSVTYVGRISRKQAEADARRRFEEWCRQPNPLARRWTQNQVVLS